MGVGAGQGAGLGGKKVQSGARNSANASTVRTCWRDWIAPGLHGSVRDDVVTVGSF